MRSAFSTGWARTRLDIGTVERVLSRNVAVVGLWAALLSACSSGSDPAPVTLPSLTATPTPIVTLEPVPPAATALTPQGAEAFVRYFFDQMNEAFRTSNASLIDALSTPDCITCNNYESALMASKKAGNFLSGPSFALTAVAATPPDGKGSVADVIGRLPARDVVDARGKIVQRLPAKARFYFVVTVKPRGGAWVVTDIALGKP